MSMISTWRGKDNKMNWGQNLFKCIHYDDYMTKWELLVQVARFARYTRYVHKCSVIYILRVSFEDPLIWYLYSAIKGKYDLHNIWISFCFPFLMYPLVSIKEKVEAYSIGNCTWKHSFSFRYYDFIILMEK